MRNFHIKIDKIGRKWITAVVTGNRSTYPVQIDRSQLPQANVGEEMDVCAEFVDLSTQYGRKYQLNIVDKNLAAEEERLQKIERWWGYLVSNYDNGNGYIYERAITELRSLNCHDYDEQIKEMRRTIENRKEVERAEKGGICRQSTSPSGSELAAAYLPYPPWRPDYPRGQGLSRRIQPLRR